VTLRGVAVVALREDCPHELPRTDMATSTKV
jgi:hypothetical protein